MKRRWQGINGLLNRRKRNSKIINKLKDSDNSNIVTNVATRIPNIFNKHFSTVGNNLASKLPPAERPFTDYLRKSKPVTPCEVKFQILSIPKNKSHGLYSCPTHLLKYSCDIISPVLSDILNASVTLGSYPTKLIMSKIIPIFKTDDETDASNYRPISLL